MQHHALFHHPVSPDGQLAPEGVLRESQRDMVHRLHRFHLRLPRRIRLRQRHLQKPQVTSRLLPPRVASQLLLPSLQERDRAEEA